jgi:hypothetical protein
MNYTINEGKNVLYAEFDSLDDAIVYIGVKTKQGWHIACLPFPSNFGLIDTGEETTAIAPTTVSLLMHKYDLSEQAS